MPLATFHHFSVHSYVDLDYYHRHVGRALHAGLYVKALAVILPELLYGLGTATYTHSRAKRLTSFHPLRILTLFSILYLLSARSLSSSGAPIALRFSIFGEHYSPRVSDRPVCFRYTYSGVQLPPPRCKSISSVSTGNPRFHPPDSRGCSLLPETDTSKVLPKARPYLLTNG